MNPLQNALDEALDTCGGTGPDATDWFLAKVLGARIEEEEWAFDWEENARRREAQRQLVNRARQRNTTVFRSHDGEILKSGRAGVRNGEGYYQQKLFEAMTWAELGEWKKQQRANRDGLNDNLAMAAKLEALQAKAPDSSGPGDAATSLGTTVAEWLAS